MKIIILGAGGSNGAPTVGGGWEEGVDRNDLRNTRLRAAAYFSMEEGDFLVECGPDFRQQMLRNDLSGIQNIFLSHGHADHMIGIWELSRYGKNIQAPVNLWGDADTLAIVRSRFPFMFEPGFAAKEMGEGSLVLSEIKPYEEIMLANSRVRLLPLPFIHKKKPAYGFKVKNVVYTPDLEALMPETEPHLYGLDLWILECVAEKNLVNGHNYLGQALDWVEKFRPKRCILNHLSSRVDYKAMSRMLPAGVELAFDNMEINL